MFKKSQAGVRAPRPTATDASTTSSANGTKSGKVWITMQHMTSLNRMTLSKKSGSPSRTRENPERRRRRGSRLVLLRRMARLVAATEGVERAEELFLVHNFYAL